MTTPLKLSAKVVHKIAPNEQAEAQLRRFLRGLSSREQKAFWIGAALMDGFPHSALTPSLLAPPRPPRAPNRDDPLLWAALRKMPVMQLREGQGAPVECLCGCGTPFPGNLDPTRPGRRRLYVDGAHRDRHLQIGRGIMLVMLNLNGYTTIASGRRQQNRSQQAAEAGIEPAST